MSVTLPVGVFVLLVGLVLIMLPIPGVTDFISDLVKHRIRPLLKSAKIAFVLFGLVLIAAGLLLSMGEISFNGSDTNGTVTPTVTSTMTLTPTVPSPTATLTPQATLTPTLTPIPTSTSLLASNCFPKSLWTPYSQDSSVDDNDNRCWNLKDWGFTANENGFTIDAPFLSSEGQSRRIYTPISDRAEIKFTIQIDTFSVAKERTGIVEMGIVNLAPVGPGNSRLIYYRSPPKRSKSVIPMEVNFDEEHQYNMSTSLPIAKAQLVVIKIDGPLLTITFDGKSKREMTIPFDKRAFWVGYSIPAGSQLVMSISDLEIINQ